MAIGLNYKDHAAERGRPLPEEPLMFLKPPSSLDGSWRSDPDPRRGSGASITRPRWASSSAAGPRTSRTREDAAAHIFGITCVNDVTARTLQDKDVQFTRAKGFDTFCPVGPWLVSGIDHRDLVVECRVNGQVRQKSSTAQLIFPVEHLVWAVSRVMTLLPGDIISTGTPAGIGPLAKGDTVEVEVGGVGIRQQSGRGRRVEAMSHADEVLHDKIRRAEEGGGAERRERQHAEGKLTARERVPGLCSTTAPSRSSTSWWSTAASTSAWPAARFRATVS